MKNKVLLIGMVTVALSLASQAVSAIPFVSGTNDICKKCTISNNVFPTWISETAFNNGAGSTGAKWIQDGDAYLSSSINDYRIFERDFKNSATDMWITSLFLSVDDFVKIKIGGTTVFNSANDFSGDAWKSIIDVTAFTGNLFLKSEDRIKFFVRDIGENTTGPTGIIYAGTATVPEPATLALLGLGLVGFGFSRRKAKKS